MPKLRPAIFELENRTIIAKIRYGMEMQSVSRDELAIAMRIKPSTFYNRLKHPDQFRLHELRAAAGMLHTTVLDLLRCEDMQR